MNTIFETRQRAAQLLKETIAIWRQSDQSDKLEGLEKDPVFSLLMMAVAYQAEETDNDIERLKTETLDELARLLTPYEISHATPATMVVATELNSDVAEMDATANTLFHLAETHTMMPLLSTHLINAKVASIIRVDGRRWRVVLDFDKPVSDLGGFAFAINGLSFRDLTVTLGKHTVPLIRPWDTSELPFIDCFDPQTVLYNRQQICNMSMLPLDLFARHDMRMFIVERGQLAQQLVSDAGRVELMFEFVGISDSFPFDKSRLHLNTTVLVNAELNEATLTAQKPYERIAGYEEADSSRNVMRRQFLHLMQPSAMQLYNKTELEVRRTNADRFNQGSLVRLIQCIINKYHSDFYAFQNIKGMNTDKVIYNLQEALKTLITGGDADAPLATPGVYLLLKDRGSVLGNDFSLSVKYLTTSGTAVNASLAEPLTAFNSPISAVRVIAPPIPGTDELSTEADTNAMLRYYMLTCDRLVTPADIKLFCRKELQTRYGISQDMIARLHVGRRMQTDIRSCGYEIIVEIMLNNNNFVVNNLMEKISTVEILLQKMIEVRSAGVYPISVQISTMIKSQDQ